MFPYVVVVSQSSFIGFSDQHILFLVPSREVNHIPITISRFYRIILASHFIVYSGIWQCHFSNNLATTYGLTLAPRQLQNFPEVDFYYAYFLQEMSLVSLQTSCNVITAYSAFSHLFKHFSLPIVANTIRIVAESNNTRKIIMTDYAGARKVYVALHEEFVISER